MHYLNFLNRKYLIIAPLKVILKPQFESNFEFLNYKYLKYQNFIIPYMTCNGFLKLTSDSMLFSFKKSSIYLSLLKIW